MTKIGPPDPSMLADIAIGIPSTLPSHPGVDASVPHAPRRPVQLTRAERALALTNVLRYFPKSEHATLLPELAEELRTLGHIYCHRLRPTAYPMTAHHIDAYPARCRQAASIMLMIMNNLDKDGIKIHIKRESKLGPAGVSSSSNLRLLRLAVAQFPHELVTYGGNGSVFSNWAQYRITMRYLSEMSEDQTLVLYSGHPLGLFPSSREAPRVVVTNGMVIPNYSSREMYERMYATGVTQYGQMTAVRHAPAVEPRGRASDTIARLHEDVLPYCPRAYTCSTQCAHSDIPYLTRGV